jgi:hypothetical protein
MAYWLDIANAVKTVLEGVAGAPTITVRKEGALHPGELDSVTQLCVVSLGNVDEEWAATGDGTSGKFGTISRRYGIVVSLYSRNLGNIQSDLTNTPDFFQLAKQALMKDSLTGVTTVWQVDSATHPAWEAASFGEGVEVSEFVFYASNTEPRNG